MERLTLNGYFNTYIAPKKIMCYRIFREEHKIHLSDPEFKEKFGEYRQRYKLTEDQIKLLNEEFGV